MDPITTWFASLHNSDRILILEAMDEYADSLGQDSEMIESADRLHDLAGELELLLVRHVGHHGD